MNYVVGVPGKRIWGDRLMILEGMWGEVAKEYKLKLLLFICYITSHKLKSLFAIVFVTLY